MTVTVKTAATENLATTAKVCLRTMRICLNEYMQRVHFACALSWSWKCCAVPELIHPAEKASYSFVSWTWDHANMLSKHPGWYIPAQTVLGLNTCPCRCARGYWTWNSTTLENWGDGSCTWWIPSLDFSITLWILRISELSPFFSPFFSTFQALSLRQLFFFFLKFITAVTVQSVIIISICFGPRHARICYWQFNVPTGEQYANN